MSVNALMEKTRSGSPGITLSERVRLTTPSSLATFAAILEHAFAWVWQLMLTNRAIGLRTAQAAQGGIVRPSASKEGRRRAVCLRYREQGPRAFYRADTV